MITVLGKKGRVFSHQDDFPVVTECTCGGEAQMMFTAYEGRGEKNYVCSLYENRPDGKLWPHDAIAVAVYLCGDCMKPVAVFNQG